MKTKTAPDGLLLPALLFLAAAGASCGGQGTVVKDADGAQDTSPEARDGDQPPPADVDFFDGMEASGIPPCWPGMLRCAAHEQCDNGVFCDGEERCGFIGGGYCCYLKPDTVPCPPAGDLCHATVCLERQGACAAPPTDADGDGSPAMEVACGGDAACPSGAGCVAGRCACEGGTDCDDDDPQVYPGRPDACDGADNDCNGIVDEEGWTALPADFENPVSGEAPLRRLHALAPAGDGWAAAWVESGGAIRLGAIEESAGRAYVTVSDIYRPAAPAPVIGDVGIVAPGGDVYAVWTEQTAAGWELLARKAGSGADVATRPVPAIAGAETIADLEVRMRSGSLTEAGVFFRGVAGGDFELFLAPLDLADLTVDGARTARLTSARGFSGNPDVVPLADGWMAAWEDERDGNKEIYVQTFGFDGARAFAADARITNAPGDSEQPSIDALSIAEGRFGIAWMDRRGGPWAIWATITGADGAKLVPETALTAPDEGAWSPFVAADEVRGQFFVAYSSMNGGDHDIVISFFAEGMAGREEGILAQDTEPDSFEPLLALRDGAVALLWGEESLAGASTAHLALFGCR